MSETIRIGKKGKSAYVSACLYAFNDNHDCIILSALGGQVSKAFDVAEKVGEVVDDVEEVDTEQFEADDLLGIKITLQKEGSE